MINTEQQDQTEQQEEEFKPDENSGILFQGFLKILDPETGEIYMQGRA